MASPLWDENISATSLARIGMLRKHGLRIGTSPAESEPHSASAGVGLSAAVEGAESG